MRRARLGEGRDELGSTGREEGHQWDPPRGSWDPPESCRRGARSQGTAGTGAVSPRGGPHGRGADREMLPPGAAAGPILEEQERDQNSTSSAPRARSASPRKALEPGQSFRGTSGTSGAPRAEQRLGRSRTSTETPGGPCSDPRATPSAVRAPDTAVPTSLGGQSLGVALEEQHIWAAVPRWIPLLALGLGVTRQLHHIPPSPPPLPDLLQGLLELPKGLRLVPLEQPPELLHHSQPLLQEGAAAPLQLPQPLQEKRSHLGLPRAPSSSCRALPKGSAQAGCPGSSCQGGTTPALMHIGKELRFGRSVPRNIHPSLKPCLLLCPSQIQLSLSLPGLPRDILVCRQSPQSAYSYKGGFPNKFF